ncbi:non-hydrolyzing UDP-N-acetylglucosamine 2-epimerase [Stieleria varia]|uniref:UDP-2,3-diacetamido-2,3-dideoxy-D-glucuronate 2-epimerase n=1 Tax=Stieleria varia TaxID=2528005 RepID=A0A5C6B3M5_9BACT|nr:UDP-N-acetylglucosamine 2-epimerase (non-hydrolyzing) [Stieleria varia]TWU05969.1 UDP-2,3-diacetamido-2,3-dideoxy-D-glucuronate 2-epimerase [Stieleria varia]
MLRNRLKFLFVVGARPNFMKVAPIMRAVDACDPAIKQVLVHTGQHYDPMMSDVFFDELRLPKPDEHLGISGGTQAQQTARIMLAFEPVLMNHQPDWLIVVGDVTSTLACALTAAKLEIPIAHVEAGLRSGDRSMPEEINRIVVDSIADLLLTPSSDADTNLINESVPRNKIKCVGNVMIDSLVESLPILSEQTIVRDLGLTAEEYVLATLHRPGNVDDPSMLGELIDALGQIAADIPVVFPVHPRTRRRLNELGIVPDPKIQMLEPRGYFEFMALVQSAATVITDSGGIQEETTYLGVPCLTVRPNTERPITITEGTNRLVKPGRESLLDAWQDLQATPPQKQCPALWDGQASQRIAQALLKASPIRVK